MKPAYVYAIEGESYALCRGHLRGWLRSRRIPAYRSNINNGWWLRAERVDDVIALLQQDGYIVRFSRNRAPLWVPPPLAEPDAHDNGDERAA